MTVSPTPASTRPLLVFAGAWSLLLFVAAFVLPAVTQNSGVQGEQPRVSLVEYFGLAGLLPAGGVLGLVVLIAGLLGFSRCVPSKRRRAAAVGFAVLLILGTLVAMAFTHFVGMLALPVAVAVLAASVAARGPAGNSALAPPAGWYPDPDGTGTRYWTGVAWAERTSE